MGRGETIVIDCLTIFYISLAGYPPLRGWGNEGVWVMWTGEGVCLGCTARVFTNSNNPYRHSLVMKKIRGQVLWNRLKRELKAIW